MHANHSNILETSLSLSPLVAFNEEDYLPVGKYIRPYKTKKRNFDDMAYRLTSPLRGDQILFENIPAHKEWSGDGTGGAHKYTQKPGYESHRQKNDQI